MILGDQELRELALADSLQRFGTDQTLRIKRLANSMLNDGREAPELIAIYLAVDDYSEMILEQFDALLKRIGVVLEHPEDTTWVILDSIMTSLADPLKNPDREWNAFIAQNWDWYEHVRRRSDKYGIKELMFLLMIYNFEIQKFDPRLSEKQEMITFCGKQQAIRDTARDWLQAFQSRTNPPSRK